MKNNAASCVSDELAYQPISYTPRWLCKAWHCCKFKFYKVFPTIFLYFVAKFNFDRQFEFFETFEIDVRWLIEFFFVNVFHNAQFPFLKIKFISHCFIAHNARCKTG